MKCREINSKLSLYLENLLDPEESAEIREHIDTCESCAQKLEEIQLVKNTLRSIEPVRAPDSLLQSINERIDEESDSSIFRLYLKMISDLLTMRHALEAAGLLAATAVILLIFSPLVKNTIPSIETVEEKSPVVHGKRLSQKTGKRPAPASIDKMKNHENASGIKDRSIGANKSAPVIVSLTPKERDRELLPSDHKSADDAFEEIRSEKKSSRRAPEKAAKKSRPSRAKEYPSGAAGISKSDSYKSAPPASEKNVGKKDTPSRIKKIAKKFNALVKQTENRKRLEVTIQGSKLDAFLNELKKVGVVHVIKKNVNDNPGEIQLYINYE